jgi:hypothetical protein
MKGEKKHDLIIEDPKLTAKGKFAGMYFCNVYLP